MSWEIFKQNVLRVANNPESINDIDIVAKTYATEYDAAIKRGGDTINGIPIKRGNVRIMERIFKSALQKGLSSTEPYDLVGEMGKGVIAYWNGATLNEFPIPIIPANGSAQNVGVVKNIVINPGTWAPVIISPVSEFQLTPEKVIQYTQALEQETTKFEFEVSNQIIERISPREDSVSKLTGILITNEEYRIDIPYTAPIITAGTTIVNSSGTIISKIDEVDEDADEVDTSFGGVAAPTRPAFRYIPPPPAIQQGDVFLNPDEFQVSTPYFPAGAGVGERAVICALTDLKDGVAERPPGSDTGHYRIEKMQSIAFAQKAAWCACAVATWWQEAGFVWNRDPKADDYHENRAYVPTWYRWAVKTSRWVEKRPNAINYNATFIPKPGDAAVYGWGGGSKHIYDHIGLVVSASSATEILGIDGNFSGGKVAYNRNNFKSILGFVRI